MRRFDWHPHLRQGAAFLLVGLAQLVLDTAVFVGLTAAGVPAGPGNVAGRVSGALLGYWLNGRITFAGAEGSRVGGASFLRFVASWGLLTVVSTVLVAGIAARLGLAHAWVAKPLVEGALAAVSFFLLRHWVYR
jgi:putative flippase GtrA